jgi:hypothetical protein
MVVMTVRFSYLILFNLRFESTPLKLIFFNGLFTLGVATSMTSSDAVRRTRQSDTITTGAGERCRRSIGPIV